VAVGVAVPVLTSLTSCVAVGVLVSASLVRVLISAVRVAVDVSVAADISVRAHVTVTVPTTAWGFPLASLLSSSTTHAFAVPAMALPSPDVVLLKA
jgi:hypothetical protein